MVLEVSENWGWYLAALSLLSYPVSRSGNCTRDLYLLTSFASPRHLGDFLPTLPLRLLESISGPREQHCTRQSL
jgi:hypothetical protein